MKVRRFFTPFPITVEKDLNIFYRVLARSDVYQLTMIIKNLAVNKPPSANSTWLYSLLTIIQPLSSAVSALLTRAV